jgi:thiol-disulfide isomerase/thioredoxin
MPHTDPSPRVRGSVVPGRVFRRWLPWGILAGLVGGLLVILIQALNLSARQAMWLTENLPQERAPIKAPELDGGDWLNTSGPLKLEDLRGKVVLLDFWTYCCINCIHILPDLEKLEKKYPNELVVIGVHSAKFLAERETGNIREAILRYHIEHPVVNDANHRIWQSYGVTSWPTFWLIDPEGHLVGFASGEGRLDLLDTAIANLIKKHGDKGTLRRNPIRLSLEKDKVRMSGPASPLSFPGKVVADTAGGRIFIADSSHHRIVITDLNGKKVDVAGRGISGAADGSFDEAFFNDPQGMTLIPSQAPAAGKAGPPAILLVADRKNHLIRALDLDRRTVTTIAGTGKQGRERDIGGPARQVGLNSPWDLLSIGETVYIAMAGHHEIWALDLKSSRLDPFAGNGAEDIVDGSLRSSSFAQPSGLATDGTYLYVADSEVSAIRAVPLDPANEVKTIVGTGLFKFGDKDGAGSDVRLQHALGVALWRNNLLVADTYNNKIKLIDPRTRRADTFLGDGKPGQGDQPPRFNEPAGIHVAGDIAYVADTNNHLIRVIDLKTKSVRTLKLEGLAAPAPGPTRPSFRNLISVSLPEAAVPTMGELLLQIKLNLPPGTKVDEGSPIAYLIEALDGEKKVVYETFGELFGAHTLKVPAGKLKNSKKLKVSVEFYPCSVGEGICQVKSQSWEMPLRPDEKAPATLVLQTQEQ